MSYEKITKYLNGDHLTNEDRDILRNIFTDLFKFDPELELRGIVQSLKATRERAMDEGELEIVVSCDAKLSTIFRDSLKLGLISKQVEKSSTESDAVKHLRPLYPNLSTDEEVVKAAVNEIARSRIKNEK